MFKVYSAELSDIEKKILEKAEKDPQVIEYLEKIDDLTTRQKESLAIALYSMLAKNSKTTGVALLQHTHELSCLLQGYFLALLDKGQISEETFYIFGGMLFEFYAENSRKVHQFLNLQGNEKDTKE